MGPVQSIVQTNSMQVENNISQISNESCINLCENIGDFNINIANSDIKNITAKNTCAINGSSCTLKATLTDSVTNDLTSMQKGNLKDEEDPSNFLNDIVEMGENQTIDQNNYMRVVNNITQQMNSTCMNKSYNANTFNFNVSGLKSDNVVLGSSGQLSNTSCIITNVATNQTNNKLANSQTASIVKEGMFGSLGALILIVVVVMLLHHKKQHENFVHLYNSKNKKLESQSEAINDANDNKPPPRYDEKN